MRNCSVGAPVGTPISNIFTDHLDVSLAIGAGGIAALLTLVGLLALARRFELGAAIAFWLACILNRRRARRWAIGCHRPRTTAALAWA